MVGSSHWLECGLLSLQVTYLALRTWMCAWNWMISPLRTPSEKMDFVGIQTVKSNDTERFFTLHWKLTESHQMLEISRKIQSIFFHSDSQIILYTIHLCVAIQSCYYLWKGGKVKAYYDPEGLCWPGKGEAKKTGG